MQEEHGKLEGDLVVDYPLIMKGTVTGSIQVADGGHLIHNGLCGHNMVLEEGSKVFLHGTVGGNVTNRGGYLEVHGTIGGQLIEIDGETLVMDGAKIHNRSQTNL